MARQAPLSLTMIYDLSHGWHGLYRAQVYTGNSPQEEGMREAEVLVAAGMWPRLVMRAPGLGAKMA